MYMNSKSAVTFLCFIRFSKRLDQICLAYNRPMSNKRIKGNSVGYKTDMRGFDTFHKYTTN